MGWVKLAPACCLMLLVQVTQASAAAASTAAPEAVKLSCDLTVTKHPYQLPDEVSKETAEVEMQIDVATGQRSIIVDSLAIGVAVANGKAGRIESYTDNSTGDRLEIWNVKRIGEDATSQEMAAVDRNTGRLIAMVITTVHGASIRTDAVGPCSKVDTTKRKF